MLRSRSLTIQIVNDKKWDCDYLNFDGQDKHHKIYQALRVLSQMLFYSPDYGFLAGLAYLIWLAIFMIALPRAILQQANKSTRVAVIVSSAAFGVICVFWVAMTAKTNAWLTSFWNNISWNPPIPVKDLLRPASRSLDALWATYSMLVLVAGLASSGVLLYAMVKLRQTSHPTKVSPSGPITSNAVLTNIKGLQVWVSVTMVSALGSSLLAVVLSFLSASRPRHILSEDEIIASHTLQVLFAYDVAVGLLFCASSAALSSRKTIQDGAKVDDGNSSTDMS